MLRKPCRKRRVTVGRSEHLQILPDPFFVLATQNPVEQEGTYPLPEAQLDRFMFMIFVDYPSDEGGTRDHQSTALGATGVAARPAQDHRDRPHRCISRAVVRRMPVAEHVVSSTPQKIAAATRAKSPQALDFCKKWLSWGAGPRASLNQLNRRGQGPTLILRGAGVRRLRRRGRCRALDPAPPASPQFRRPERRRHQRRHRPAHPGKNPAGSLIGNGGP